MAINLDHCKIHPSSSHVQELSLPLTHFDIPFLQSDPDQTLVFYDFPCSKPHFLETILPCLKKSLSTTLTNFLPLTGNIILPSNSGMPLIRYTSGDSVSLTVAQSDQNFSYLTSNHQRVADEFYHCVPALPPAISSPSVITFPSSLYKSRSFHSRVYVLASPTITQPGMPVAWVLPVELPSIKFPINKVRSTFILTKNQVQNLKNYVSNNRTKLNHISSFVVISAHIWTCLAKTAAVEEADDDAPVYFMFAVDCRARLSPPLPAAYFGNCIVAAFAESRHGLLKKKEGFFIAVESIVEAIRRVLNGEKGIIESAKWPLYFAELSGKCVNAVAGSPRFDMYETDFGWGKPRKHEFVHLDRERSISLAKSREFEGGFEVGLSRNKIEMDVFESTFHQGMEILIGKISCHTI
ncbi:hypothetical protein C2S52_012869 [Perilla frutescens var. hirtella]|nr:hypothetical protein C2S52_012869 [Perilla frutescens var. hirtella]